MTNNQTGISASFATGTLDHVLVSLNSDGVSIDRAIITAVDTTASANVGSGFFVGGLGNLFLAHSTATGNGTGVFISAGPRPALATSFGDNHIKGNGTDVKGTLTKVGTQ